MTNERDDPGNRFGVAQTAENFDGAYLRFGGRVVEALADLADAFFVAFEVLVAAEDEYEAGARDVDKFPTRMWKQPVRRWVWPPPPPASPVPLPVAGEELDPQLARLWSAQILLPLGSRR